MQASQFETLIALCQAVNKNRPKIHGTTKKNAADTSFSNFTTKNSSSATKCGYRIPYIIA